MKTCLFGLIFLGLTNLSTAQHDLAMATTQLNDEKFTSSSSSISNENYLNLEVEAAQPLAICIKKLQKVAADFDVTKDPVYSKNKSITYTVNFQSNENRITAVYNTHGIILNSEEYYEDVRLPVKISNQLAKDYPGWAFHYSTCNVSYDHDKGSEITYTIDLKKENKHKSISLTI
ncbi:hypothetical protein ITJ86_12030 [Winogradskyella sp. F6397]|uniref:Nicotinate-nucleotide adenylyltransferase n=1 Tax=Winogradskyella marina TaxID=2785530 RepID=A0ABS0EKG1_9FLAO|nr:MULTISPECIES: hypothetical protein [Winogradskyella]MBF8150631.1 hypothetical protein [Winogradskyella marina]